MAEVTFSQESLFKEGGENDYNYVRVFFFFFVKDQTNRSGVEQSLHATVNILVPMNPALHKVTAPGVSTATPRAFLSLGTHHLREDWSIPVGLCQLSGIPPHQLIPHSSEVT